MSSLQETIQQDLQKAMKAREAEKLSTLRLLKSDIQYELTKTGVATLTDEEVMQVIQKSVKKRHESLVELQKAGRSEEVEEENRAIELLKSYLPEEASDEEIIAVIKEVIRDAGPNPVFGKVMGPAMAKLKGKADGSRVRALVESSLPGNGN